MKKQVPRKSKGRKPAVAGLTPAKTEANKSVEVQAKGVRSIELTQEVADRICEHLEEGGGLRAFCAKEGNPTKTTVLKWLKRSPAFAAQYAEARARGMDVLAEEIIAIADDQSGDTIVGERGLTVDAENIARARLRVDARKWLMSKLAPKKYGDKVEVEHSGEQKHTIRFTRG